MQAARRPHSDFPAKNQAQVECRHVTQQPLQDVPMPLQMRPPHSARVVDLRQPLCLPATIGDLYGRSGTSRNATDRELSFTSCLGGMSASGFSLDVNVWCLTDRCLSVCSHPLLRSLDLLVGAKFNVILRRTLLRDHMQLAGTFVPIRLSQKYAKQMLNICQAQNKKFSHDGFAIQLRITYEAQTA